MFSACRGRWQWLKCLLHWTKNSLTSGFYLQWKRKEIHYYLPHDADICLSSPLFIVFFYSLWEECTMTILLSYCSRCNTAARQRGERASSIRGEEEIRRQVAGTFASAETMLWRSGCAKLLALWNTMWYTTYWKCRVKEALLTGQGK